MKLYVAGKTRQSLVPSIMARLTQEGHEITCDWTQVKDPEVRPYSYHSEVFYPIAFDELKGIDEADALVLVDDENLKGALIEVGYALAQDKEIHILARGNPTICDTIFWALPPVSLHYNVEQLLVALR